MNMPGFTAETSLHSDGKRSLYAMAYTHGAHESAVVAQLAFPRPVYCYFICFETHFGWKCQRVCVSFPLVGNGGFTSEI